MKKVFNGKYLLVFVFLGILAIFFIANLPSVYSVVKAEFKVVSENNINDLITPQEIEAQYDDGFYGKMNFVDINGLVHKLTGSKIVNGAIKGENDKLFLETDKDYKFDSEKEKQLAEEAVSILDFAEKQGAEVLYVQRPMKFIEGKDKLPYGFEVEYNDQYDLWCEIFSDNKINVLDLRKSLGKNLNFYKTDHHWTVETSFYAAKNIVDYLHQKSEFNFDESKFEEENYYAESYRQSFLGSEGVKTGKYYVGKDDFNFLVPEFETDFEYEHYIEGDLNKSKKGDFKEAFIDTSLLEDENYNNKYNSCLNGGYVENIIKNNNYTDGKKLLLISDSYARPMVQYLSMAFSEIRYLDPQEGRYNDSYIEYIEKYKPDYVIMMYTGEFVEL